MRKLMLFVVMAAMVSLVGCSSMGVPKGITPVSHFDTQRYLGEWYEIARLEHSFEKGLSDITATYSLRDDGGINVLNRGYDAEKDEWRAAQGRAYPVGSPAIAHLKVSFFRPFYGSYIIFGLDKDYRYSFVTGPDKSYLWLLSRSPRVPDELLDKFIREASELGFDTDKLIYVKHK